MTPLVEKRMETEIGFQNEFKDENFRAYLELLLEEINEKTEFNLRAINWRHYSDVSTRILVKRKETDITDVIRSIQVLGLKKEQLLSTEKVKAALAGLLAET